MAARTSRVAAVWRGDPGTPVAQTRNHDRLAPIFAALTEAGLEVEPVLYRDDSANFTEHLTGFDGVLVWVDPISDDDDRTVLDAHLRDVAAQGTWVSAHPDTILKMGTKEVLYRTRNLGWGAETRLYSSVDEFRSGFPASLTRGQARVLKQNRGNGGIGVWKVTPLGRDAERVRVQHAAPRDDTTEDVAVVEFMDRWSSYLDGPGILIDQPFAPRFTEGMIRAYLVEREVVGFARQQPIPRSVDPKAPAPDRVFGMPSAKTMSEADVPEYRVLRALLEREWVPEMCRVLGITDNELPVLWDGDFLYGPRTQSGADTYMLCEINVSSVLPFPPGAPAKVAVATKRRCAPEPRSMRT